MSARRPLLAVWVLLATVFAGRVLAQDRKPFDQLAPENALAFISFRDVGAAKKWLDTSAFSEAWKSREVQDFVKEAAAQLEESVEDKEAYREFTRLLEVLEGEVAVVVGDVSKIDATDKNQEAPVALLADVSRNQDKAREAVKRAVQTARDKGKLRISESDFRGTKIQSFAPKEDAGAKDGGDGDGDDAKNPTQMHVAEAPGLVTLSFSKPLLQDILANRTEATVKPLAESSEYKSLRERFGKDAALVLYVNTTGLVQTLPKLLSQVPDPQAQQAAMFVPGVLGLLGIANLKAFWVSGALGKEEVSTTYFLSTNGAPRGLLKILAVKPQALKFPSTVPDDVASCTLIRYNPEAVWELIEGIVKMVQGFLPMLGGPDEEGGGQQDPIAAVESRLGIKLKQDLFGPLGGQLVYYDRLPKDAKSADAIGQIALLLDVKDREKLQSTFDKILGLAPFLKKSDYLGRPIYGLAEGALDEEGTEGDGSDEDKAGAEGGDSSPFALAITESHFVIGVPRSVTEEIVRRVGKEVKSVNDSAGFKAIAGLFPPTATSISYQSAESFQAALEMLGEIFAGAAETVEDVVDDPDEPASDEAKKARGEAAKAKKLLGKLPKAATLTKPIAGFIGWGFSEERGIGAMSKIVFKRK